MADSRTLYLASPWQLETGGVRVYTLIYMIPILRGQELIQPDVDRRTPRQD